LFLFVCLVLCFSILIQEAKSLGLGASFGGDGGDSLFGTSTAEVLKRFTAYVGTGFFIGSLILSLWSSSLGRSFEKGPDLLAPTEQEAPLFEGEDE